MSGFTNIFDFLVNNEKILNVISLFFIGVAPILLVIYVSPKWFSITLGTMCFFVGGTFYAFSDCLQHQPSCDREIYDLRFLVFRFVLGLIYNISAFAVYNSIKLIMRP